MKFNQYESEMRVNLKKKIYRDFLNFQIFEIGRNFQS